MNLLRMAGPKFTGLIKDTFTTTSPGGISSLGVCETIVLNSTTLLLSMPPASSNKAYQTRTHNPSFRNASVIGLTLHSYISRTGPQEFWGNHG